MRVLAIFCAFSLSSFGAGTAHSDWHEHAAFCQSNTDSGGSVECPGEFIAAGAAECILAGGRACLVIKMRGVALSGAPGACSAAQVGLSVCQCHNSGARQEILSAPTNEVCGFLQH